MMHSGGSCKVEASAKSQQSNLVSVNVCQQKLLKGLWALGRHPETEMGTMPLDL